MQTLATEPLPTTGPPPRTFPLSQLPPNPPHPLEPTEARHPQEKLPGPPRASQPLSSSASGICHSCNLRTVQSLPNVCAPSCELPAGRTNSDRRSSLSARRNEFKRSSGAYNVPALGHTLCPPQALTSQHAAFLLLQTTKSFLPQLSSSSLCLQSRIKCTRQINNFLHWLLKDHSPHLHRHLSHRFIKH